MTSALTSTAVMNSRLAGPESLDYFPTPPWATRALIEEALLPLFDGMLLHFSALDPACGELHMVEPLKEYFGRVDYSDVHDWGPNPAIRDFTFESRERLEADGRAVPDFIITNPPFNLGSIFVQRALELAEVGVAMFVRIGFLPGQERYQTIYRDTPPTYVCIFTERVALIERAWDPEASSATDYVWLLWIKGMEPQPTAFFPPGMQRLYSRLPDLALAKPGEAARRAELRKKKEAGETGQTELWGV